MLGVIRGSAKAHSALYAGLFAGNVLCNKYVLSELEFTYPTIFQGWQVLVGACFLKGIATCSGTAVVKSSLDKPGFISLLPTFLLFVGTLVAGSKALAVIEVPQFVACLNLSPALIYLFDDAPKFRNSQCGAVVACAVVVLSTVGLVVLELEMTFSDSPYFWMLICVLCASVHIVHGRIADARFEPVDRLYYSYLVGVCLLAPASLYLDEAFQALNFAKNSRFHFFVGCLASGFFGVTSCYIAATLTPTGEEAPGTNDGSEFMGIFQNVGKCLAALLSIFAFQQKAAVTGWILVCVMFNLIAGFFIPVPKDPTAEVGFKPLPTFVSSPE
ncbi:unnamed protein product [Notodromas monacha]|uniref:Transmembrane protein 241 n=1 Tax=Notodromas monacha TaxID=399045 RepID=A0A7R9GHS1_9CRUS|nr:unnamed protein product [Notodromas monacha]CAG0921093.1 unnamed protein product [Notodromas monacha]